ncbi:MAG: hypothetical protein HZC54_13840 [Verrucomicrobia bacterium]|nr:hypothetical protein [Verrucomicrobiota bacterium]
MKMNRRSFIAAIPAALWQLSAARGAEKQDWLALCEDPARKLFAGKPDLDRILALHPRLTGPPAFDPELIANIVAKLTTKPAVNTGHKFLDLSVKTGLAHIEATFQGDHPKYGVGTYAGKEHDGFPPTIIAAVDALTLWGLIPRAEQLFGYWLDHFVKPDGTIAYYGPSLGEYGQLLTSARRLMQRGGSRDWFAKRRDALDRLARHLQSLIHQNDRVALVSGVPEADERKQTATYFHNNAWIVRGLEDWAALTKIKSPAAELRKLLLDAIHQTWPKDANDWWLSPTVEPAARPQGKITATRVGSYTNYRYWPELLSSRVLPRALAVRVVNARLCSGGQFCGMTRFANHLDDWPLADYLDGLWSLGRKNDFLLSLYGHVAYHQAEGHLTAYEQVTLPPGKKAADYCLPCQLVAARAARVLAR